MKPWMWAVAAGIALGLAYTLSPLTVFALSLLVPFWSRVTRGLGDRERRWLLAIVLVAVALRLLAIAGLFVTADPNIPYANFFGDEEFFKRKTTWLRNVNLGIPIHNADYLYAYDVTGDGGYIRFLTYLQALFGLAPYGIHVLNMALYVCAVLLLFRIANRSFGGPAALVGTATLLFLPSLFLWSISALKEPLYFMVGATNLVCAYTALHSGSMWRRVCSGLVVFGAAFILQSLREGGMVLCIAGVAGGVLLTIVAKRPPLAVAAALLLPVALVLALRQPAVQHRAMVFMRQAAYKHWGHVNTPGQSYKLMDAWFYADRQSVSEMQPADAVRYTVRAIGSYLVVPAPWQMESRATLAFLPEQVVWYILVLLAPIGVVHGFRRDPALTGLFVAHAAAAALIVAISGGNIGTLVRHRGLALPYLTWLSAVGGFAVARRLRHTSEFLVSPTERPA